MSSGCRSFCRQQDDGGGAEVVLQAERGSVLPARHGPSLAGSGRVSPGPLGNTNEDERHTTTKVRGLHYFYNYNFSFCFKLYFLSLLLTR